MQKNEQVKQFLDNYNETIYEPYHREYFATIEIIKRQIKHTFAALKKRKKHLTIDEKYERDYGAYHEFGKVSSMKLVEHFFAKYLDYTLSEDDFDSVIDTYLNDYSWAYWNAYLDMCRARDAYAKQWNNHLFSRIDLALQTSEQTFKKWFTLLTLNRNDKTVTMANGYGETTVPVNVLLGDK